MQANEHYASDSQQTILFKESRKGGLKDSGAALGESRRESSVQGSKGVGGRPPRPHAPGTRASNTGEAAGSPTAAGPKMLGRAAHPSRRRRSPRAPAPRPPPAAGAARARGPRGREASRGTAQRLQRCHASDAAGAGGPDGGGKRGGGGGWRHLKRRQRRALLAIVSSRRQRYFRIATVTRPPARLPSGCRRAAVAGAGPPARLQSTPHPWTLSPPHSPARHSTFRPGRKESGRGPALHTN